MADSEAARRQTRSVYSLPAMQARTVTFLLTDVEKSTRLWQKAPDAMKHAIERHDQILNQVIGEAGGEVLTERGEGDSFFAVFPGVSNALAAAVQVQRRIGAESWSPGARIKVRIAVHTGEVGPDYRGPDVNRCARLRSIANGGQILVSAATAGLARPHLRGGLALHDLGRHRLRDLAEPEHVFQLNHPDVRSEFPRLRRSLVAELPSRPEPQAPPPAVPATGIHLRLPGKRILTIAAVAVLLVGLAAGGFSLARSVLAGPVITTIAGNGQAGESGDGGNAVSAKLGRPAAVALDLKGDLFIADPDYSRVREVTSSGLIIDYAGGVGPPPAPCVPGGIAQTLQCQAVSIGDGRPATEALVDYPAGLAVAPDGDLYIADKYENRVRLVTATTHVISTVAGNGASGYAGDGGPARSAELSEPDSVALDGKGDLFIADSGSGRVREVTPDGIIHTVAGGGASGLHDGDPATEAQLAGSFTIAVDPRGDLYIADPQHSRIREVTGGIIRTVAGTGDAGYSGDGEAATSAKLDYPSGIAFDAHDDLFIADTGNHVVREVIRPAGLITTVAGIGKAGSSGDLGPATSAELNFPTAVVVDSSGRLYIADGYNYRIRRVSHSP